MMLFAKLHLVHNWKTVLRHSSSLRLIALAGLLSGIEAAMPFISSGFRAGYFALATFIVTAAAFVARLVAQQAISGDKHDA